MLKNRVNFKPRNVLVKKVKKLMKNTDSSKTIEIDQISAIFLKYAYPFIAIFLSEIIKLSVKFAVFLTKCEIAKIKP